MYNALIVYDLTGFILLQMQGDDLREPVGIPYIRIAVPEDKYVSLIDTSVTPHVPIFESLQKSAVEIQIETLQQAVADIILNGGGF